MGPTRPGWEADFAALRVTLAHDWRQRRRAPEVWLLCERGLGPTGRSKQYLVNLPPTARLPRLVRLAHQRWAIEQQYQDLKELRVVDTDGREVAHDGETLGEIVVRGNVVMEGYYDDPEATAEAMRDGWFHSGDVAVVHPDGYAEIRYRFKDVIISGGENISSVEVEGVLMRHPAVQEAAIVGIPDRSGERRRRASWCSSQECRPRRRSSVNLRAITWPTSRRRGGFRSSGSCRRRRPERFRSTCCAVADGRSRRPSSPCPYE